MRENRADIVLGIHPLWKPMFYPNRLVEFRILFVLVPPVNPTNYLQSAWNLKGTSILECLKLYKELFTRVFWELLLKFIQSPWKCPWENSFLVKLQRSILQLHSKMSSCPATSPEFCLDFRNILFFRTSFIGCIYVNYYHSFFVFTIW